KVAQRMEVPRSQSLRKRVPASSTGSSTRPSELRSRSKKRTTEAAASGELGVFPVPLLRDSRNLVFDTKFLGLAAQDGGKETVSAVRVRRGPQEAFTRIDEGLAARPAPHFDRT